MSDTWYILRIDENEHDIVSIFYATQLFFNE